MLRFFSDLIVFLGLLRLLFGGVGDLGGGTGFGIAFLNLGFLPRILLVGWISVKKSNKLPFILMGT